MTIDNLYRVLLDASFNKIIKTSANHFPSRTPGTIDLGIVIYNILRKKFDDDYDVEGKQPKVAHSLIKSYYCHLRNWLYENQGNIVECLPMIDAIESHSYSSSRRNDSKIKVDVFTSSNYKKVPYADPKFVVYDKDNPHNNSVMIGRKLTSDGYKNVMTSVDVCI